MKLSIVNKIYFFRALILLMSGLDFSMSMNAQTGQRFKRIDYGYDQISGKVNEVHYQAGEADAFYHKYEYNADNRITIVHTSKDSVIWDEDARYIYYDHGSLARVELGDNNVQGIDYAYTLQGWTKGVNSNLLKAENDIGWDGLPNGPHPRVAKDAFGYTLNYHAADYQAIDNTNWNNTAQRFEALTAGSDLMAARFDLFNGNIGSMVTTLLEPRVYTGAANEVPNILPQGTAYQYDQLNRLLQMKAFQNLELSTNAWEQGSTYNGLYHNTFKYDANGNILGQLRADGTGTIIDSLTYKYAKHPNNRTKANRLHHVNDKISPTAFTDDIDDQGFFVNAGNNNYGYDEIGNLRQDKQERIEMIQWTVFGKIKSMTRFAGSSGSDLEFQYDANGNRIAKIEKPRDITGVKPPSDWITTYYIRDEQGNIMAVYRYKSAPSGSTPSFMLKERNLFGCSRLGIENTELELVGGSPKANPLIRSLANKWYEASNHLGNVLCVFTAKAVPASSDGIVINHLYADIVKTYDYTAFGAPIPKRTYRLVLKKGLSYATNPSDVFPAFVDGNEQAANIAKENAKYQYGFNGQEKDDEILGNGNTYTAAFWEYDARLGRRWNVDPVLKNHESPYAGLGNNPITLMDVNGNDAGTTKVNNGDGTGTATVTANVYLVQGNINATQFNAYAAGYGQRIQNYYNNSTPGATTPTPRTFVEDGVTYTMNVQVNVIVAASVAQAQQQIAAANQAGTSNILTVGTIDPQSTSGLPQNDSKIYASGNAGFMNINQQNADPHEFAHLLGLGDRYNYFMSENTLRNGTQVNQGTVPAWLETDYDNQYANNRWGNLMSVRTANGTLTNMQLKFVFSHGNNVIPAQGHQENIPGPTMYYFSNMGLGFNQRSIQSSRGSMLSPIQLNMPQYQGSYSPSQGWKPSGGSKGNYYNLYQNQTDNVFNR